jgi:hypothetical protein
MNIPEELDFDDDASLEMIQPQSRATMQIPKLTFQEKKGLPRAFDDSIANAAK